VYYTPRVYKGVLYLRVGIYLLPSLPGWAYTSFLASLGGYILPKNGPKVGIFSQRTVLRWGIASLGASQGGV